MPSDRRITVEIRASDYEALRAMLDRYGYEYFGHTFTDRLARELGEQLPPPRDPTKPQT